MRSCTSTRWTAESRPVSPEARPRAYYKDDDLQAVRDQEARRLAEQLAADYCGLN